MDNEVIIIGIAGSSGSGKSLLARTLVNEIGSDKVVVLSEDCYYKGQPNLTPEERDNFNYDHPSELDHRLLFQHLRDLREGLPIEVPTYDFAKHTRLTQTTTISNYSIIVVEGILIFIEARLRRSMNIRIFMDTPLDICLIRRLRRDTLERGRSVESVLKQYEQFVRPMYLQFVEPCKMFADIIIPRGGENRIAIDMLKAKMNELLHQTSTIPIIGAK